MTLIAHPTSSQDGQSFPKPDHRHAEPLRAVEKALDDLRFGTVLLTLHEGRVVQIDVTARQRFT